MVIGWLSRGVKTSLEQSSGRLAAKEHALPRCPRGDNKHERASSCASDASAQGSKVTGVESLAGTKLGQRPFSHRLALDDTQPVRRQSEI